MNKNYVFTEMDYNSGDGMMTLIWGPPLWHVLHTISFNYPIKPSEDQKTQYYNFYNNLQNILPCRYCRENLQENFKKIPLDKDEVFKNRYTLSKYVYDLHELVNSMLGKTSNLTYEDVRDRYEHFRSRCLQNSDINNRIEKGCTEPLYGVKSKCVLNIIPKDNITNSLNIDEKCLIKKISNQSDYNIKEEFIDLKRSSKKGSKRSSKKGSKRGSKKDPKRGSKKGSKRGSKKGSKRGSKKSSKKGSKKGAEKGSKKGAKNSSKN